MIPTRIDRQFVNSQREIGHAINGERDLHLIKRLVGLVSFAFQYPILQEDIFGTKIITAKDVATIFNLSRNHLNTLHPNPQQLRDKSIEEINNIQFLDQLAGQRDPKGVPCWYSNLDNALYQLFYTRIPYNTSKIRQPQVGTTETVNELKVMRVFSMLRKVYINKTRASYYEYHEAPEFIINNARYFIHMDFKLFSKLTLTEIGAYMDMLKTRATERYMLISQIKKVNRPNLESILGDFHFPDVTHTTSTIDYLAAKWDIQREDGKEGKSQFSLEHRAINKIVDSINKKAGYTFCEVTWEKARPTDRHKGQPVLHFPYPVQEKEIMQNETAKRFDQFNIYFLKQRFREYNKTSIVNSEDFKKKFVNYLHDARIDPEGKRQAGFNAGQIILNSDEYLPDPNYPNYVTKYISSVLQEKTLLSPKELGL